MFKNIKSNRDGFTIVETLIVLAIAATIIIIVLLAVPALQRTARNNDIKTDASTVAGEISEFESDNNGTTPTAISNSSTSTLTVATTSPALSLTTQVSGNDFITTDTTVGSAIAPKYLARATQANATAGTNIGPGQIVVFPSDQCPTTQGGAPTPTNNAFAVFFPIEGGAGNVGCVQS